MTDPRSVAPELVERIERAGQSHVFRWWNELNEDQRERLLSRLRAVDFDLLERLLETLVFAKPKERGVREMKPPHVIRLPRTPEEEARDREAVRVGEKALRAGRVASLVVAGGQGTRLGFPGPKGTYPFAPVTGRTLFEWHAAKIAKASERYGRAIPWYVMTSETNDDATRTFFEKHNYFGLGAENVFFFVQAMMPAVDRKGKLLLSEKFDLAVSPNGHGGCLFALRDSGALDDMRRRGIDLISYFQVDNPLVPPVDPRFIGHHLLNDAEMSSKVMQKRDIHEGLGVVCILDGELTVVEYSDMTLEEKKATFDFASGSIAVHIINVDFVERVVSSTDGLPYHLAEKKIPYIDETGRRVETEDKNGYKFEMFIFDALRCARRSICLEVDRKQEFSPLKNAEGEDSPATVRRDLSNLFGGWLESVGASVPRNETGDVKTNVEIWPNYAADAEELKGKVPSGFICQRALALE